jgi:hypothetical protein
MSANKKAKIRHKRKKKFTRMNDALTPTDELLKQSNLNE